MELKDMLLSHNSQICLYEDIIVSETVLFVIILMVNVGVCL